MTLRHLPPLCALLLSSFAYASPPACQNAQLDKTAQALMDRHGIPGMSVAVIDAGEVCLSHYGVATQESGTDTTAELTNDTLFEVGSLSKTFTAALGAWVHENGGFALDDTAASIEPRFSGRPVGEVSMAELATYTAGGFPLQFPSGVDDDTIHDYFVNWQPDFAAGTQRLYSNPSIGLFGLLAAQSDGASFAELMQDSILPTLGLSATWLTVPDDQAHHYAQGYNGDEPVRVNPGPLDAEAYGIKTTALDMARFIQANIDAYQGNQNTPDGQRMAKALLTTHHGYAAVGDMQQGLGWESYALPTTLETLMAGTTAEMALEPQAATMLATSGEPQPQRWYHKTGSTGGFGAYAAFIPSREQGIVILANKRYPNGERVEAAWQILNSLDQ
ncbi:MAG: class C beta-lactamase [Pseudomonadota bacterium]|nr:class C beta-lactamase [Pseudomonadota bacterium]